jgi:predicted DNA-binding transcriptional regulator AlpA
VSRRFAPLKPLVRPPVLEFSNGTDQIPSVVRTRKALGRGVGTDLAEDPTHVSPKGTEADGQCPWLRRGLRGLAPQNQGRYEGVSSPTNQTPLRDLQDLRTPRKCSTSRRVAMSPTNTPLRSSDASTREAYDEAWTTNELLSQRQVALRLGVSARTLEGWRARGVGPPFLRLSARAVRYRSSDLEQWLDQRRVADGPGLEARNRRSTRRHLV